MGFNGKLVESTIEKSAKIPPTGRDKPPAYNGHNQPKHSILRPHKSIKRNKLQKMANEKCQTSVIELINKYLAFFSVIRLGLKPRTHSLEGCCSIQLSYRTKHFGKLNIHLTPVRFFMLLFRLLSIASAKVITFLLLCKKKLVFQFL